MSPLMLIMSKVPVCDNGEEKHVSIPDGQKRIEKCAFERSNLEGIDLPDSLTSIEGFAFSFCTKLTAITLPDGVDYIGQGAFNMCESLESVNVPRGVRAIRYDTFRNCSSLRFELHVIGARVDRQGIAGSLAAGNCRRATSTRCKLHEQLAPGACCSC